MKTSHLKPVAALVFAVLVAGPALAQDAGMQAVLDAHNSERARLGIPPLQWDGALAEESEEWAKSVVAVPTR